MRIHVSLWVLVATGIVLSGCADIRSHQVTTARSAMSDSQLRSWQYSRSVQGAQASSLLDTPNDPPLSDQSLIAKSKEEYIRRGFDAQKAEQCAKEDFISATGRTPNPSEL